MHDFSGTPERKTNHRFLHSLIRFFRRWKNKNMYPIYKVIFLGWKNTWFWGAHLGRCYDPVIPWSPDSPWITWKSWASRITPILMASANPSTTSRRLKVLKTVGSAKITWRKQDLWKRSCDISVCISLSIWYSDITYIILYIHIIL